MEGIREDRHWLLVGDIYITGISSLILGMLVEGVCSGAIMTFATPCSRGESLSSLASSFVELTSADQNTNFAKPLHGNI